MLVRSTSVRGFVLHGLMRAAPFHRGGAGIDDGLANRAKLVGHFVAAVRIVQHLN